jgi:HlyD family secretion protein
VERRRVQQAGVYADRMEISEGLAAGDVIAVKGAGFLKDGDTVTVANAAVEAPAPAAAAAGK